MSTSAKLYLGAFAYSFFSSTSDDNNGASPLAASCGSVFPRPFVIESDLHLSINYRTLMKYRGPATMNVLLCNPPGTIQVSLNSALVVAAVSLNVISVGTSVS